MLFRSEANNSYDFLKNQKQVFIYPHYSEKISSIVDKDRRTFRTLMIADDASGELLKQIDATFIQIITTTRHYAGCTVYVCVHSCKKILSPIIRQNLDSLFIYRIINARLLDDLYQEYFSMLFDNFKEFKKFYLEATEVKNSCIHFSLHTDGLDINVRNWGININRDKIKLSPHQAIHKPKETKEKSYAGHSISSLFYKSKQRK